MTTPNYMADHPANSAHPSTKLAGCALHLAEHKHVFAWAQLYGRCEPNSGVPGGGLLCKALCNKEPKIRSVPTSVRDRARSNTADRGGTCGIGLASKAGARTDGCRPNICLERHCSLYPPDRCLIERATASNTTNANPEISSSNNIRAVTLDQRRYV